MSLCLYTIAMTGRKVLSSSAVAIIVDTSAIASLDMLQIVDGL